MGLAIPAPILSILPFAGAAAMFRCGLHSACGATVLKYKYRGTNGAVGYVSSTTFTVTWGCSLVAHRPIGFIDRLFRPTPPNSRDIRYPFGRHYPEQWTDSRETLGRHAGDTETTGDTRETKGYTVQVYRRADGPFRGKT